MFNSDLGLLLLRITAGGYMSYHHGFDKFMHFSQYAVQFPDPLGVGATASLGLVVFAEFVCGALLAVGLFSRLALLPLMTAMGVAFFVIHKADPFEKKELALIYFSMYVVLFFTGSGKYSLQEIFKISAGRFTWLLK